MSKAKNTQRQPKQPKPLAFEIRDSGIAGRGAFALRHIAPGERLIEYTGERIPHPLADERYDDDSMDEHHTFLFTVSSRTVIDATHGGNESRYINHSCDPNCETEIVGGRVYIYAIRPIVPGEELHYDYAYERSGDEGEKEEAQYKCLCGTPQCRGSIMEPKEEFEKRQRAARRKKALARAKVKRDGAKVREQRTKARGTSGRKTVRR